MVFNLIFTGTGVYHINNDTITYEGKDREDITVNHKGETIIFGKTDAPLVIQNGYNFIMSHSGTGMRHHSYHAGNMVNSVMGDNNVFVPMQGIHLGRKNMGPSISINEGVAKVENKEEEEFMVFDGVKYKRVERNGKRILVAQEEDSEEEEDKKGKKKAKIVVNTHDVKFSDVVSIEVKGLCSVHLDMEAEMKDIYLRASGDSHIVSKRISSAKKVRVHTSGNSSVNCSWDCEYLEAHASGNSLIKKFHIIDDGELRASGNSSIEVTKNPTVRLSDSSSGNARIVCNHGVQHSLR